jgi:hypothetical protein
VSPSLAPLPQTFGATVDSLHRVAEQIVAPARKPDNEIALEATGGGFGTPEFEFEGARHRVRVEAGELVHEAGGEERRAPLGTLAEAGRAVAGLLPAGSELSEDALAVDATASLALGAWYELGAATLSQLVAEASPADEATPPRLWPEHFDIAIEMGPESSGARANYGLSPGDGDHPEPYAYVGPWTAEVSGELWRATGFRGAELGYSSLFEADDPVAAALDFFRTRRDALARTTTDDKETK